MRQRDRHILNMKNISKKTVRFGAVVLLSGALGLLTACTFGIGQKDSFALLTPTSSSHSSNSEHVIAHEPVNSYSLDKEGNVSVSYQNGKVKARVPLKLDTTGTTIGMSKEDTGFYISDDKTAIVYGFADGQSSPLHVLISNDMGKTWNDYEIKGAMGYDKKFIGFTTKNDGWLVSGGSAGVGRSLNHVYQTSNGGLTWNELGNPNDLYSEQLTGAGFSNKDIGFLGFRYYSDNGPNVYWTINQGQSWEKLSILLPAKYNEYQKTPLSPIFNGKEGLFPLVLHKNGNVTDTIYLISNDYGLTWNYEASHDKLDSSMTSF
ncbi:WD40/YVTN/BNR-like repeat-containing protein [Paenibacillus periandrae]|uniref:WD40/YVTN/BNR-like repeat-containing protein n=1 Tax=Paenibacillus periandrae TaxID=1761741 RepID=UPI001F094FCA|nr:hypothetical protein [Paenibacillus periandrae]